jgi:hypothetical protein
MAASTPMRKTKPIVLISASVVLTIAIAAFVFLPRPGTVPYHLQRLGDLRHSKFVSRPSTLRDYLRSDTWLWYLRGKPSLPDMEQEQQALIQLGYFERRELTFRHRSLDAQLWSEFRSAVSNSPLAECRYMLHLDDSRPSVIRVTTYKTDIPVFERIVSELDAK